MQLPRRPRPEEHAEKPSPHAGRWGGSAWRRGPSGLQCAPGSRALGPSEPGRRPALRADGRVSRATPRRRPPTSMHPARGERPPCSSGTATAAVSRGPLRPTCGLGHTRGCTDGGSAGTRLSPYVTQTFGTSCRTGVVPVLGGGEGHGPHLLVWSFSCGRVGSSMRPSQARVGAPSVPKASRVPATEHNPLPLWPHSHQAQQSRVARHTEAPSERDAAVTRTHRARRAPSLSRG